MEGHGHPQMVAWRLKIEPWRAIHNGGVEAQNEAVVGLYTGCCWLFVADSLHFDVEWM
jgi:hypothetical protein